MEIKKLKEKIIEALDGKIKAERLTKEYVEAENKLLRALEELKNFGSECDCDKKKVIEVIADGGEYPEISSYCMKCGGFIDG